MDQLLDPEALDKLTPEQQEKVLQGVRQQAAIMHAQNLITVSFEDIICNCCSNIFNADINLLLSKCCLGVILYFL